MKKETRNPITLLLTCLLTFAFFTVQATACPDPECTDDDDCPDCYKCESGECVNYDQCLGGCWPCSNCVDCWCVSDCHWSQYCCNGSCCDNYCCPAGHCCNYHKDGKYCCYGGCCDLDTECCEGDCCDPEDCESCVDGWCQVCGGDPDKICCDGECKNKCEEFSDGGINCSTSHDLECLYCQYDIYKCSENIRRVYTGQYSISCFGGCPGDCQEPFEVLCYTEYTCFKKESLLFHRCTTVYGIHCEYVSEMWPFWCNKCAYDIWSGEEHFVNQALCAELVIEM